MDSGQPFGLCLPLLLPHSTSKDHDVTNVRGKDALKTIEVLVAFREHERRSPVTHGLHDLVADSSIPGLIINQELVKRLELVDDGPNIQVRQNLTDIVQTAARDADVMRMSLGAADDTRFVVSRWRYRSCCSSASVCW